MKINNTTYQIFLSILSVFILLFLQSCNIISLDKTEPAKTYYSFNKLEKSKASQKSQQRSVNLVLMQFTATSEFRGNQFIYKKNNQHIKDYYNRFFMPPEKMIQTMCANWLKDAGIFKKVSRKSQISFSDKILKGKIIEIYCDRSDTDTSYAIIKIKFSLIEYNETNKTIMEKDLYSKVKFKGFSSDNLIIAWTKCLKNILQNLESEISSVI